MAQTELYALARRPGRCQAADDSKSEKPPRPSRLPRRSPWLAEALRRWVGEGGRKALATESSSEEGRAPQNGQRNSGRYVLRMFRWSAKTRAFHHNQTSTPEYELYRSAASSALLIER